MYLTMKEPMTFSWTLNTLCKDFICQVLRLRHFSGITAPIVAGYHTNVEGGQQLSASLIIPQPEGPDQYTASFGIVGVSEPVLPGFTANKGPLLIKFTEQGYVGVSNRKEIMRRGKSFLKHV